MRSRLGVDIGGTFTDLTFFDGETGSVSVAKSPTTPESLEQGVLEAVASAVPDGRLGEVELFMHGTTVALNALITRSGARTGLICTRGFRDVVEIGRGDRAAMYDMFWRPPAPLVPRRHRLTVSERIRADGEVLERIVADDVITALRTFQEAEIESIAVCLLNSYANPSHELEVEQLLRGEGFDGDVALSHRLSREYREFERSSTTIVDAYIRPTTTRYVDRLVTGLRTAGFAGDVLVTRSGGGAITTNELSRRPFEAIQSGPVAGVEGAASMCRARDWPLAITADVGGTSFDTALVVDGRPKISHEGEIEGRPVQTSWVEVASIGAGGGSIARAEGGLLKVGPHSAGATPGPACYRMGGTEPTVTDAALLLGMFGDGVLSSTLSLDRDAAAHAIAQLAAALPLSDEEAARGVLAVTTSAMAEAIREITIGQGEDPRDARLIVFGGAGPLFACLLAAELDIPEVIVPPHAGNFSALGLLEQDVTQEVAQTVFGPLEPELVDELNGRLAGMFDELDARHPAGPTEIERSVAGELRYTGQEHAITIPMGAGGNHLAETDVDPTRKRFAAEYERRFGTTLSEPLELVTLRATARLRSARLEVTEHPGERTGVTRQSTSDCFSFSAGRRADFAVYERAEITSTEAIAGPALVFEPTATTYVDEGFELNRTPHGALSITASGRRREP